jgi:hypothetical protein
MVGKPCTQKLVVFHYSDFASLAFEDFSWKIQLYKTTFSAAHFELFSKLHFEV